MLRILERRYLATVTTSGAGVGVAAAVPAIGTGAALALSGAETVLFLEVDGPVRPVGRRTAWDRRRGSRSRASARARDGRRRARAGAHHPVHRPGHRAGPCEAGVLGHHDRQEPARGPPCCSSWTGCARCTCPGCWRRGQAGSSAGVPFGVGAVIGGTANQLLGRRVIRTARTAFGPAPLAFPREHHAEADRLEGAARAAREAQRAEGDHDGRRSGSKKRPPEAAP